MNLITKCFLKKSQEEHPRDASGRCIESKPNEAGELIGRITTSRFAASGQFEGYTNRYRLTVIIFESFM